MKLFGNENKDYLFVAFATKHKKMTKRTKSHIFKKMEIASPFYHKIINLIVGACKICTNTVQQSIENSLSLDAGEKTDNGIIIKILLKLQEFKVLKSEFASQHNSHFNKSIDSIYVLI